MNLDNGNQTKLYRALSVLTPAELNLHSQAIKQGYKDEICSGCGAVLLAQRNFFPEELHVCPDN